MARDELEAQLEQIKKTIAEAPAVIGASEEYLDVKNARAIGETQNAQLNMIYAQSNMNFAHAQKNNHQTGAPPLAHDSKQVLRVQADDAKLEALTLKTKAARDAIYDAVETTFHESAALQNLKIPEGEAFDSGKFIKRTARELIKTMDDNHMQQLPALKYSAQKEIVDGILDLREQQTTKIGAMDVLDGAISTAMAQKTAGRKI